MKLYYINHSMPRKRILVSNDIKTLEDCIKCIKIYAKNEGIFIYDPKIIYTQSNGFIDVGNSTCCFILEGICEELKNGLQMFIDRNDFKQKYDFCVERAKKCGVHINSELEEKKAKQTLFADILIKSALEGLNKER